MTELTELLGDVDVATLGHFVEEGFPGGGIHHVAGGTRMVGRAFTVAVVDQDSRVVNEAIMRMAPGSVLVISMKDTSRHAPIGSVTMAAARGAGVRGVVVDGPVTDIEQLRGIGIPVFATGTSALTTKPSPAPRGEINLPVTIGGVDVTPGDVVLGDENGLLVISEERLRPLIPRAVAAQEHEAVVLRRIEQGESLRDVLSRMPQEL